MTINEIYNYLQPYCKAIYKTGSQVLNLNNCRDNDYVLIYENDSDKDEMVELLINNRDYDFHYYKLGTKKMRVWAYLHNLMEYIVGNEISVDIDILGSDKKDYIECLYRHIESLDYIENYNNKKSKGWYYILAGLYMIENNSYELTFIQKANVQLAHDKEVSEELKEYCRKKIKYYRGVL